MFKDYHNTVNGIRSTYYGIKQNQKVWSLIVKDVVKRLLYALVYIHCSGF